MAPELKKNKNWFRRHLILSALFFIFLVFFFFLFVGIFTTFLFSLSDSSSTSTEEISPQIYYAGDIVTVGDFQYRVNSYRITSQIGEDLMGTFIGSKASGIYLVLSITIENIAKESKNFFGDNIVIIDSEGRRFKHDLSAEMYLGDQQFNFEQMQPGLPKTGRMVFDVPKDIHGLIEISSDSIFSNERKLVSWNKNNQSN